MNKEIVEAIPQMIVEMNVRSFCDMEGSVRTGTIIWVEAITITDIAEPEKQGLCKRLVEFFESIKTKIKTKIKRKKGLLWQLQNSLQD